MPQPKAQGPSGLDWNTTRLPTLRLDHVFVSTASIEVTGVDVPRGALARVASDHLPLVVDVEVAAGGVVGRAITEPARPRAIVAHDAAPPRGPAG